MYMSDQTDLWGYNTKNVKSTTWTLREVRVFLAISEWY